MEVGLEKYIGDVDEYIELQRNSHIPYREQWTQDIQKAIELNRLGDESLFAGIPYGLFVDGVLVGACKLVNFYSNKDWIEIFDFVISPEHRSKSLGSQMISFIIDEIKNKYNRNVLVLSTGDAKSFYEKQGFKCFGDLKGRAFMYKEIE